MHISGGSLLSTQSWGQSSCGKWCSLAVIAYHLDSVISHAGKYDGCSGDRLVTFYLLWLV